MFYQIFLSPKVKRWTIITYKHGTYESPHELPNDLRLTKLGNIREVSRLQRMIAQPSCQNESFVNTSRKLLKNRNETFPVIFYFMRKLELVSNIL